MNAMIKKSWFVVIAAFGLSVAASAKTVYIQCSWKDLIPPDTQSVEIYNGSSILTTVTVRAADNWKATATIPDSVASPTVKGIPVTNGKASTSTLDYGCKLVDDLVPDTDMANYGVTTNIACWQAWGEDTSLYVQIEGWEGENGWQRADAAKAAHSPVFCKLASTGGPSGDPIYRISNEKMPSITYDARGDAGYADGTKYHITVSDIKPSDAQVEYRYPESGTWTNANPTFTTVGSYQVYFRITKEGYIPVEDSRVVNISAVGEILCSAEGYRDFYGAEPRSSSPLTA